METTEQERNRESGFTLIDLLLSSVVVGVLTAVAIVGIDGLVDKGQTASCKTTMDAVRSAMALHYANNGCPADFPTMEAAKELQVEGGLDDSGGTLRGMPSVRVSS